MRSWPQQAQRLIPEVAVSAVKIIFVGLSAVLALAVAAFLLISGVL